MQILFSFIGFILAIGILTFVHEFGHYWVARRCGIKILRFSIGFGKPLFTWHDKLGTEYAISMLPFGGYLKLLDENEGPVSSNERHMAFNRKPVGVRMLVICAGAFFNILFAVLVYWLIFVKGVTSVVPLLDTVPKGSIADLAGLKKGQEIIQVEDVKTNTWEQISAALMPYIGEKAFVKFTVKNTKISNSDINKVNLKSINMNNNNNNINQNKSKNNYLNEENYDTNQIKTYILNLNTWSVSNEEGDLLKSLGIRPYDPTPAIVGRLKAGFPAEESGLIVNDRIIAVDDIPTPNRTILIDYIRKKSNQLVTLEVQRENETFTIPIKPVSKLLEGGEEVGFVGIEFLPQPLPKEMIRTNKLGIIDGFVAALVKTKHYIILTLQFLYKIVVGKVSVQHIAGPVLIAKFAGQSALSGITSFFSFLALISISLGVLNMLPIPVLDGGYFAFYVCELIMGRPVPEKITNLSKVFGVIILSSLMIMALFNDIMRF